jgi:cobalt-zinc-cadmium efflux system protein
VVAFGGLIINIVGLRILYGGKGHSLNIRGAWLHVFTDALGSIGAIVAGLLIWLFGWNWADPAISVLIGLLVIFSSWRLFKETVQVLIWTITSGMVALSVNAVVADRAAGDTILNDIQTRLYDRFSIEHTTIQIETEQHEEHPLPI